jgi:hypothetical protein
MHVGVLYNLKKNLEKSSRPSGPGPGPGGIIKVT